MAVRVDDYRRIVRRHPGIVAVVTLSVLLLAGCTTIEATGGPVDITAPPPTGVTPVPVPTSVQRIPDQPPVVHYGTVPDAELGVPYEYHLYVHCGIRIAEFAGRSWIALPHSDPLTPDAEIRPDQYLPGAMTLLAPDRAMFVWSVGRAEFEPAPSLQPLCA